MSSTLEAPVRSVPQQFVSEQQVIVHLPYGSDDRLIPVVGVIVAPGTNYCIVRVRSLEQGMVEVVVPNGLMEVRG